MAICLGVAVCHSSKSTSISENSMLGKTSATTLVGEIMTNKVCYVGPEHTVDQCMALMSDKNIRHLPVLEHGAVMGVVSMRDVVRATLDEQAQTIEQLVSYIQQ